MTEQIAYPTFRPTLSIAPSRIPMHNRLGQLTMRLEEGKVYFGTGYPGRARGSVVGVRGALKEHIGSASA